MRKKGFTLIELTIVIGIIGILMLLAAPAISAYVKQSGIYTCQNHRSALEKDYRFEKNLNPSLTMEQTILSASSMMSCPSGGVYRWDDRGTHVICSIHGGKNEAAGGEQKPQPTPDGSENKPELVCGLNAQKIEDSCYCKPGYAGDPYTSCTLACRADQVITKDGCTCPAGYQEVDNRCVDIKNNGTIVDEKHGNEINASMSFDDIRKAYVESGKPSYDFAYWVEKDTVMMDETGFYITVANSRVEVRANQLTETLKDNSRFIMIIREPIKDLSNMTEEHGNKKWDEPLTQGQLIYDGENYYVAMNNVGVYDTNLSSSGIFCKINPELVSKLK